MTFSEAASQALVSNGQWQWTEIAVLAPAQQLDDMVCFSLRMWEGDHREMLKEYFGIPFEEESMVRVANTRADYRKEEELLMEKPVRTVRQVQ